MYLCIGMLIKKYLWYYLEIWDCYLNLNDSKCIYEFKNSNQNLPPEMETATILAQ